MGSAILWLALAWPAPDAVTTAPYRTPPASFAADPFLAAAALMPPADDDPLLRGVRLLPPQLSFTLPVVRPPAPGGAGRMRAEVPPRLDPALRPAPSRVRLGAEMPGLDETMPLPARRDPRGGALSGRLVLRVTPEGSDLRMAGGIVGALWRLVPRLD